MSAALPPTVKHAIAVGHMSKGRVVKGIEQMWCRASKSARGDGKFAATMWRLLSSTPVLEIALQPLYFTKPDSEGHGKSGHLSERLRRKAPRRYFTFTLDGLVKYPAFTLIYFHSNFSLAGCYTMSGIKSATLSFRLFKTSAARSR